MPLESAIVGPTEQITAAELKLRSNFYPNVTTLRSGLRYRNSVCRLSVVCNVGAPYSEG